MILPRPHERHELEKRLDRARVVLLVGPRQSGKTTLARSLVDPESANYFDLESPSSLARLDEPMNALEPLRGLVVIDEVQLRPDLFPVLRVLADRRPLPARFLVLGSAQPAALRQSAESLTGRISVMEIGGLRLSDLGAEHADRLWLRGAFPEAALAPDDDAAAAWLADYARSLVERDLPAFDVRLPTAAIYRLLAMVVHRNASVWSSNDPARSLGISEHTVRRYLDLLTDALVVRQLPAWFANITKRQVRAPKVFIRDSGLAHALLEIRTRDALLRHPASGGTWEGMALEETLRVLGGPQAYFWRTHNGAELDLYLPGVAGGIGVEVKRQDAPRITASMRSALTDLELARLFVIVPGERGYDLAENVHVLPVAALASDDPFRVGAR